jgi:hypothetical protein
MLLGSPRRDSRGAIVLQGGHEMGREEVHVGFLYLRFASTDPVDNMRWSMDVTNPKENY